MFARVGAAGYMIEVSCDGKTWRAPKLEAPKVKGKGEQTIFRTVYWRDGLFVAAGGGTAKGLGGHHLLYTSTDGVYWHARRSGPGSWLAGAGYFSAGKMGTWVVGGGGKARLLSVDKGVTWSDITADSTCRLRHVISGADRIVGVCDDGLTIGTLTTSSSDPVKWIKKKVSAPKGVNLNVGRGAYGNGRFIVAWPSKDVDCQVLLDKSNTWKPCTGLDSAPQIVFDAGWFYATRGEKRWTTDGFKWVKRTEPKTVGKGGLLAHAKGLWVYTTGRMLAAGYVPPSSCKK